MLAPFVFLKTTQCILNGTQKCGFRFFIWMFFTSGNYQKKYFTQIKMILTRFHEGTSQIKNKFDIKRNLQYYKTLQTYIFKKCLFNK